MKSEELQKEYSELCDERQRVQELCMNASKQHNEAIDRLEQTEQQYGVTLVDYQIGKATKKEADVAKKTLVDASEKLKELKVIISFSNDRLDNLGSRIIALQNSIAGAKEKERLDQLKVELNELRNQGKSVTAIAKERNMNVAFVEKLLGIGQMHFDFKEPVASGG